jgi:hypothetical protein
MLGDKGTKPSAELFFVDKVDSFQGNSQIGKVLNIADSSWEVA